MELLLKAQVCFIVLFGWHYQFFRFPSNCVFLFFGISVWACSQGQRHLIIRQISEYVLARHLLLTDNHIVHFVDQLDFCLLHGMTGILFPYIIKIGLHRFYYMYWIIFLFYLRPVISFRYFTQCFWGTVKTITAAWGNSSKSV